jgi:hypothetical protein
LKSSSQLVCKTGADLKKTLQKALHELGPGGNKLILNLETFGNFEHMISNKINFPKDPSVGHCTGSPWMTYSWNKIKQKYQQKYHYQEESDLVSSKNNVVLWQLSIWMPKNYKSKYSNPNSMDTSISIQHIDRKGFSCTISQENIPI